MSDGQRKRYGTDVGPWDLDVGPWDLDVGRLDLRDEGSKLHVCHADMHFDVGAVVVQLLQRPCRLVRTIHEERACPTRTVIIVILQKLLQAPDFYRLLQTIINRAGVYP